MRIMETVFAADGELIITFLAGIEDVHVVCESKLPKAKAAQTPQGRLGQRSRSSNSRQRSSSENVVHRSIIVTGSTPMDATSKKQELSKVPTRKLLASLKLDIRRP